MAQLSRSRMKARSELAARFEALAQHVANLEANRDQAALAVGVTSCQSGEGVSTIASNLAMAGTNVFFGRVLLVEARSERANFAKVFKVDAEPGLFDLLRKDCEMGDCVRKTSITNLSLLPAGGQAGARGAFASPHAVEIFDHLRRDFSFIVVDLPPIGIDRGAVLFPNLLNGFLLASEPSRSRLSDVYHAREKLAQAGAKLYGLVLNKFQGSR